MSRDAAYWLSKRVRVGAACDPSVTMAEGVVLAYASAPTIMVRDEQGRDSTWQVTLPIDVLGEVPVEELPPPVVDIDPELTERVEEHIELAKQQIEWAVEYEERARPISSPPQAIVTRRLVMADEQTAREAAASDRPPWDLKLNRRAVWREVTEWEQG